MNTPILVFNTAAFSAADTSTSLTSSTIDISEVVGYSVHSIWTGTTAGSLAIQGSNDGINFVTIATVTPAGSAAQDMQNQPRVHYTKLKVVFTRSGGTGLLTCYVSGKRN